MAEKAMELIGANLRRFVANRQDEEAAAAMLSGSMFAGIAFAWARLGNIHAMSHPVSAFFNVPHGVANGILFPYIVKYNEEAAFGKYQKIYNYISTEKKCESEFSKGMLEQAVRELNTQVGILRKPFGRISWHCIKRHCRKVPLHHGIEDFTIILYKNHNNEIVPKK